MVTLETVAGAADSWPSSFGERKLGVMYRNDTFVRYLRGWDVNRNETFL